MPEFFKGDVVTVRATVAFDADDSDERVLLKIDGHYQTITTKPEDLVLVHRHFEPGQRVVVDGEDTATILGIDQAKGWIRFETGQYGTVDLALLEPIATQAAAA